MNLTSVARSMLLPALVAGSAPVEQLRDEDTIRGLVSTMAQAFSRNDADSLDAMTADDYSFVTPSGILQSKLQRTTPIRARELVYQAVRYDDVKVRVYGFSAVVTTLVTVKGQLKGSEIGGTFRSTLTFAKNHGRWKLVASQANTVTAK